MNPCDPCVANWIAKDKQHAVTWHADDVKSSHVDPKVNDEFQAWLEPTYGKDGIGKAKTTRGHKHHCLAVTLDCSVPGKLKLDVHDHAQQMIDDFPERIVRKTCPWTEKLFKVDDASKPLNEHFMHLL